MGPLLREEIGRRINYLVARRTEALQRLDELETQVSQRKDQEAILELEVRGHQRWCDRLEEKRREALAASIVAYYVALNQVSKSALRSKADWQEAVGDLANRDVEGLEDMLTQLAADAQDMLFRSVESSDAEFRWRSKEGKKRLLDTI